MIEQQTNEVEETEELDGVVLLRKWQEKNRAWHFEGDRGVERLENLVKVLGYPGTGFRFGNPVEQFLSDNPGAMEALVVWIEEQLDESPEWRENMTAEVE